MGRGLATVRSSVRRRLPRSWTSIDRRIKTGGSVDDPALAPRSQCCCFTAGGLLLNAGHHDTSHWSFLFGVFLSRWARSASERGNGAHGGRQFSPQGGDGVANHCDSGFRVDPGGGLGKTLLKNGDPHASCRTRGLGPGPKTTSVDGCRDGWPCVLPPMVALFPSEVRCVACWSPLDGQVATGVLLSWAGRAW